MEPKQKRQIQDKNTNKNISILLVDDNRVNQFLGKRILQNLGISNIEIAGDGITAFELIKNNNFDVLLTDVEMPGLNGYELSEAIRSYENNTKHITIIALTANASDEDRELAKKAGIDDYLTKPYSPQDLQDMLLKYLHKKEKFIFEDLSTLKNGDSNDSIGHLYTIFHHNKDDVRHFLHMLSGQIPLLTSEIKAGIELENWEEAFQAAHKLKSPVKMLGGNELVLQLNILSEQLNEKKATETALANFEIIAPSLESLLVLVNRELEKLI